MADEPADEKEQAAEIGRRGALAALGALGSAAFIACTACSGSSATHQGSGGASGAVGGGTGGTSGAAGGQGGGSGGSGGMRAGTGGTAAGTGGAAAGTGGMAAGSGGTGGGVGGRGGAVVGASGGAGGGMAASGGAGGKGGAATGGVTGSGGIAGTGGAGGGGSCHEIPEETAGPFPDTKGMIDDPAFHRSDIREGRAGVALTLTLTIVDIGNGCAPISGAQVEIWHCDPDGIYSEYANAMNAGSATTTYLRGVQVTDAAGTVTFKTIYPGWYSPRATHIHVQVYSGTVLKKTTQIGFPDATSATVYTPNSLFTALYTKGQNPTTNDTDQVFGNGAGTGTDGGGHLYQIAAITGDPPNGYMATLPIGVTGYSAGGAEG
jgi:protocatechuate 3,4-dioxygenase beta subunit